MMVNEAANSREGETSLFPAARVPMEIIHIDHFGPLQQSPDGYKHILVVVDAFTRFTWLFLTRSTTSRETILYLNNLFSTFGSLSELVSDRATAFSSNEFAEFIIRNRVKHRMVAVAFPWANGMVERVNRFLKSSLVKLIDAPGEWRERLGALQYIINNTHHAVTKSTPAKLLLGYEQRNLITIDFQFAEFVKDLANIDVNVNGERDEARDQAAQATDAIRQYNKQYRDGRMKKSSLYREGEYVLIRDLRTKPGENTKLKAKYFLIIYGQRSVYN